MLIWTLNLQISESTKNSEGLAHNLEVNILVITVYLLRQDILWSLITNHSQYPLDFNNWMYCYSLSVSASYKTMSLNKIYVSPSNINNSNIEKKEKKQ